MSNNKNFIDGNNKLETDNQPGLVPELSSHELPSAILSSPAQSPSNPISETESAIWTSPDSISLATAAQTAIHRVARPRQDPPHAQRRSRFAPSSNLKRWRPVRPGSSFLARAWHDFWKRFAKPIPPSPKQGESEGLVLDVALATSPLPCRPRGRVQERTEPSAPLRTVELFAGVGGFRLGLEGAQRSGQSGFEVVWSNQYEPSTHVQHAAKVYQARWGKHELDNRDINVVLDDLQTMAEIVRLAPEVLVGGFPCQDYSVARPLNQSQGLQGKKGALWWSIHRMLKALLDAGQL